MRVRLAHAVSALAVMFLLSLSAVFARAQNRPPDPARTAFQLPVVEVIQSDATQDTARGRAVYDQSGCARCHTISGVGSSRNHLDGVGSRREPANIRAWLTGSAELADSLPRTAFRNKQEFASLPAEDLDVLVGFLSSLK